MNTKVTKIVASILSILVLILALGLILNFTGVGDKKDDLIKVNPDFYITVNEEKAVSGSTFNINSENPLRIKVFATKEYSDYEVKIVRNKDIDFMFVQDGEEKRFSDIKFDFTGFFQIENIEGGFILKSPSYDLEEILEYGSGGTAIRINFDDFPFHKPLYTVEVLSKNGKYSASFGLLIDDVDVLDIQLSETEVAL